MSTRKDMLRLMRARDSVLNEHNSISLKPDDLYIPEILTRSFDAQVTAILPQAEALVDKARNYLTAFAPTYEDLTLCWSVERLIGLPQFGIKADMFANEWLNRDAPVQVLSVPSLHSRWNHSQFAGAIMFAFGLHLGLSFEQIATGTLGALLHDLGHPAFGHDLDDILVGLGRPDHEERGQAKLREDKEIHESLEFLDIDVEDVIQVIQERGALGRMQNIADTLSYVVLDSCVAAPVEEVPVAFVWEVLSSVEGIEGTQYRVNDPEPITQLVNLRANMYRDLYWAYPSRIAAHVLRNLYQFLVEKNLISPEYLESATDNDVKSLVGTKLSELARTGQLPDWVDSTWALSLGFYDELDKWRILEFKTKAEAEQALARRSSAELASSVMIEPGDYRKKAYQVITPDGVEQSVQAPLSHIPEIYKKWYVLYYPTTP